MGKTEPRGWACPEDLRINNFQKAWKAKSPSVFVGLSACFVWLTSADKRVSAGLPPILPPMVFLRFNLE